MIDDTRSDHGALVTTLMDGLSQGRPGVWRDVASPSFEHHVTGIELRRGVSGAMELAHHLVGSLRDIEITPELRVSEHDWFAQRSLVTARISATGKRLAWVEHHMFRFDEQGLIDSWWPTLRLHRLLAVLRGESEPAHQPTGTRISRIPGFLLPRVSRIMRPLPLNNREVVHAYIERFKNQQQFAVFPRIFAPNFRHHFGYDNDPGAMLSWVKTGQDFLSGFPDVKVKIHALIEEADCVVELNTATGTHNGAFRFQAPPTGQSVQWNEIHFYRLKNHKIVENWPAVDFEGIAAATSTLSR
jgi:predicted ester cyclase